MKCPICASALEHVYGLWWMCTAWQCGQVVRCGDRKCDSCAPHVCMFLVMMPEIQTKDYAEKPDAWHIWSHTYNGNIRRIP